MVGYSYVSAALYFFHFILLFSLFIVKLPLPSSSVMLSTIDAAKMLSEIVIDSLNQE